MNRRNFIAGGAALGVAAQSAALGYSPSAPIQEKRYQGGRSPWPICLDTATIRPATLKEKINIASAAGYDAIEPWDMELRQYEEEGGNLKDLGKEIRDKGLFVPSMIGLWGCIPQSEEAFGTSLEATRNRMRMASEIGCEFVQAIPNEVGDNYNQQFVASCYRRLLEIGINDYNVKPALVFVKMFPIKTLGQAVGVALDSDHPEARVIPDVYHMLISQGGFRNMKDINGDMFAIFQYNDAPKNMDVDKMEDGDRVYPGDGILPLTEILKDLKSTGFSRCVSLELYNAEYHAQDLSEVAKTGLEKTLATIEAAGV